MARSITVNTGEKIEVKNSDGELLGFFYFNPADVDMLRKCKEAENSLNGIMEEVKKDKTEENLEKLNTEIRKQVEAITSKEAGDIFFKYNSPLSIMADGAMYGLYVFNIICKFIEGEVGDRSNKMKEKFNQYTAQYD